MAESRTKKSLLNAKVNFIFYALSLVLTFFSRKIFLDCLGTEFLGFASTLQNLLGFLNLAELGIGTAIAYVLYKPLFAAEQEKISEIVSVLGYLYRGIGLFILASGIVFSLFLPRIFPDTEFGLQLVYVAYYSFLASSLIGYFINYRQNLLAADQRNYVVTGYFQGGNILKTFIQMGFAYYTGSYYLWIAIELIFGIVYACILNWKINRVYPWLKTNLKQGRSLLKKYPEVVQYSKQLFIHKVCGVVQWQTVPFLTYVFVNLQTVALYGNYVIITDKLAQFFNTFMESTGAGIGNLIAEGNKDKIKRVFWELLSFRYFMGAGISFCVYMLIEPFISLWLGAQFLLDKTVLFLIVVNIFISFTRGGVMQFLYGYGLYSDIWAPIAEIVINLSIACVCGCLWGLPGVLMGGIVSQILIINIWKPFFLYRSGFKDAFWEYVLRIGLIYLLILIPMPITGLLCIFSRIIDPFTSFISWCGYASVVFCSYYLLVFTLMMFFMPPFRHFMLRIISCKCIQR